MHEILELSAFALPGVLAIMGMPYTCLGLLLVYWAGHTMGATRAYKRWTKKQ